MDNLTAVFYDEGRRVTARVVEVRKDESGVATFTTEDAEGVRRDVLARMASVDRRVWRLTPDTAKRPHASRKRTSGRSA